MGDLFSYGLPGGIVPGTQGEGNQYTKGGGPVTQLLDPTKVDQGRPPGDATSSYPRSNRWSTSSKSQTGTSTKFWISPPKPTKWRFT